MGEGAWTQDVAQEGRSRRAAGGTVPRGALEKWGGVGG